MPQITAARALTAHIAYRFIRLATFVALGIFAAVLLLCWVLAYFFTAWWWLLVVPFAAVLFVFLIIRFIITLLVRRIHAERLRSDQRAALDSFVGKLERLIEARGTPPIFFVLISIKDLLIHRDITTIKELISDTTSLRRDYQELEKLF
ncbi:MAG: hypothetical protein V4678_04175 [Patescibacteria group bacterium]